MKRLRIKVLSVMFIFGLTALPMATANADGTKKMIEAWFGTTSIKYNDQDLTGYLEPFSWNETTYLPLRKIAEIFNKNISWDANTQTVLITDTVGENNNDEDESQQLIDELNAKVDELKGTIDEKDEEISQLEERLKEAKEQPQQTGDKVSDIDGLEEILNEEYGSYNGIDFEIVLSGNEDKVILKVGLELNEYEDKWNALRTSDKLGYLQQIVDTIYKRFGKVEIDGYIRNISRSSMPKIMYFYAEADGDVLSGTRTTGGKSPSTVEDELNERFGNYFNDIEMTIDLSGTKESINFRVNVDLKEYRDEWRDLTNAEIEKFLYKVYFEIKEDFPNAVINGSIYNKDARTTVARLRTLEGGGIKFETQ